jgi:hypothetical protein
VAVGPHSRTDDRIAEFVIWSALAVYAAAWVTGITLGLGGRWLVGGGTAPAYVGMHAFEITRRGHCYLSADSTSVPVSLLVFSLAVVGFWAAGDPPQPDWPLALAWGAYSLAFTAGHALALGYSVVVGSVLTRAFRHHIAAEKAAHVERAGVGDTGRDIG